MTDDLDSYRADAKAWCEANLATRSATPTLRGAHDITPEQLATDRAVIAKIYDAGYSGITLPTEYGGRGLSPKHERIWQEESASFAIPSPGGIAWAVTQGIVLPTILAHASETQKREWVPKMLRGDEIWVQLLSEPDAGSDLAGVMTKATQDGESWVLNGTKVWSSGAMCADFGVCLARTDWDAPKHRGLTWFKVPMRDPNMTVRPLREINGSAEFCEEFLDDVVVGDEMVIGEVNGGWPIANYMLGVERSGAAGGGAAHRPSGSARQLAPDLVALAEERGLTGDPATRQLVAQGHIDDWAHGQLTKRIIESMISGKADPSTASLLKLDTGLHDPQRASIALQIAGRRGVVWRDGEDTGFQSSTNFLNGRVMSIAGGSNQIQRNIISERGLGLPREPSVDGDKPFSEVLRDAKSWGARK